MSRRRNTVADFARFAEQLGRPLEPFQRKIAAAHFGRERELVVLIPKGNAKSTLAALLALHHLLAVESPYVLLGAGSRDQARVCYEIARELSEHPSIADQFVRRHLELRAGGGLLRVVASDGGLAHGPTPSLSICDELWAHRDGGMYEAMRTALIKRPDARLLVITTAPRSVETPLGRLRGRALAGKVTRRGVYTDARAPGLRLLEWSLAAEDDFDDPKLAKACNPGSWISEEALIEQRLALPMPVFAQFHLDVMGAGEGQWLPPGAWTACLSEYEVEDGEPVWAAVDVGGSRASTAVLAVTADLRVAAVEVLQGDDAVLRVPEILLALAGRYQLREVAYDPWRFASEALRLERDHGLLMSAFPQSHTRMTIASEGLHKAIVERKLQHRGHRALDAHVAAAAAKQTGRGWRLVQGGNAAQIDAVIALAMVCERAQHVEQPARLLGWL